MAGNRQPVPGGRYDKIGGLLLVFIVTLFLSVGMLIFNVMDFGETLSNYVRDEANRLWLGISGTVFALQNLSTAGLIVYLLVIVYRRSAASPARLRKALLALGAVGSAFNLLALLLAYLLLGTGGVSYTMANGLLWAALRPWAYVAVWVLYFHVSVRVKVYYGTGSSDRGES